MARVNTGSHVNVNTLNFSVGVGNNIQNDFGLLSVGAAFEAGFGKFKNHFNAGKADPYIKKNGDISYYGVAVLSNMAFENLWHVNGTLRYGRIKTSQNRALFNFSTNQAYDIDLSSYYIGAELGGGKVIKLDDLNALDLYGKYFFLHQDISRIQPFVHLHDGHTCLFFSVKYDSLYGRSSSVFRKERSMNIYAAEFRYI